MTLNELYRAAKTALEPVTEDPTFEAACLLEHFCGANRTELLLHGDKPAAGVFGRMRFAGMFCISMRRAKYVVPAEHKSDAASAMTNSTGSYSMTKPGMLYSMP